MSDWYYNVVQRSLLDKRSLDKIKVSRFEMRVTIGSQFRNKAIMYFGRGHVSRFHPSRREISMVKTQDALPSILGEHNPKSIHLEIIYTSFTEKRNLVLNYTSTQRIPPSHAIPGGRSISRIQPSMMILMMTLSEMSSRQSNFSANKEMIRSDSIVQANFPTYMIIRNPRLSLVRDLDPPVFISRNHNTNFISPNSFDKKSQCHLTSLHLSRKNPAKSRNTNMSANTDNPSITPQNHLPHTSDTIVFR